jgi:hypothetical protein
VTRRRAVWIAVLSAAALGGTGWFWLTRPALARQTSKSGLVSQAAPSESGVHVERING